MLLRVLLLVVTGHTFIVTSTAVVYSISSSYLGDQCDGTPYQVVAFEDANCTNSSCSSYNFDSTVNTNMFSLGYGYPATGSCVGAYNESYSVYAIAKLNKNGSASFNQFLNRTCFSNEVYMTENIDKETIASHSCDVNQSKWYSSNDVDSSSGSGSTSTSETDSGLSNGSIVGIALSASVIFFVLVLIYMRRSSEKQSQLQSSQSSKSSSGLQAAIRGQSGLWSDDAITAKRIPRDKVVIEELISRGAFGEVYKGVFNGRQVAVKMLLPASREKLHRVNEFLSEIKMTATMEHPHIVSFVGVAWDSLSDLCVVLEYMHGGELRTLLNKYEAENHSVGFDKQKTTIALHVCHALTYLHSLMPSVIHRDLKSRNILLDGKLNAKLSDFSISRERLDQTMTAGVGTSLWMAPEVMLGERYDDKVDMFSFGVVLSELDVHTRPYARVKKEKLDSNGREMTDSVLLQKVALGHVQVEFSKASQREIAELGRACISIDPTQRPSAAEALYRLQTILSRMKN